VFDADDEALFPWGFRERPFGRRTKVPVQARLLHKATGYRHRADTAFIVPAEAGDELFAWLYEHADVRKPAMVYIDESVDFMAMHRAMYSLRRLVQQGREIGVGLVIVHQRPAWIDQTFFSESQRIICGSLYQPDDLKRMMDQCRKPSLRKVLATTLPARTWAYLDQQTPANSRLFKFVLDREGAAKGDMGRSE
jgi:hypothetical protein